MPTGSSPVRAVTMVTPLAHRARVSRKSLSLTLSIPRRVQAPPAGGAVWASVRRTARLTPVSRRTFVRGRAAIRSPVGERLNPSTVWTVESLLPSDLRPDSRKEHNLTSTTFADLGVSDPVSAALAKRGITSPFQVQELVIPTALGGRDVLVSSPTGSGKTLAFGLPLIERLSPEAKRPAALILAPTRELASQIDEELRPLAAARGLTVAVCYGGVGFEEQARRASKAHILVATPGRLLDLARQRRISLAGIRCSCSTRPTGCSTWASCPRSRRSCARCRKDRHTMFFSATLDGAVGTIAEEFTTDADRLRMRESQSDGMTTLLGAPDPRVRPLRVGRAQRDPRRPDRRRGRPRARLLPHPSRRRQARRAPRQAGHLRRGDARRPHPGRPREGAAPVLQGQHPGARGHRRRRARHRPRRHRARRQLRPARGRRRLHPPRRAAPPAPAAPAAPSPSSRPTRPTAWPAWP